MHMPLSPSCMRERAACLYSRSGKLDGLDSHTSAIVHAEKVVPNEQERFHAGYKKSEMILMEAQIEMANMIKSCLHLRNILFPFSS
jgi:hypothetical protein